MTTKNILAVLTILIAVRTFGQKADTLYKKLSQPYVFSRQNSFNLEAFGHGRFYSINYERIIINNPRTKFGFQIGTAFYPERPVMSIWTPFSANYIKTLQLSRPHHLEFGAGLVIAYDLLQHQTTLDNRVTKFATIKAGYRFQKSGGPWIFKALLTPLMEIDQNYTHHAKYVWKGVAFYPYLSGALSLGHTF